MLKATLGDWRFVAFVSTLLLCGLPASTHASPHSPRRAPTRPGAGSVRAGSARVVFGADGAFGGSGAFEHVDVAPPAPSHEWLPATFDLDSANDTDDDDDDGLTAPAAAVGAHRLDRVSGESPMHDRTFACLARPMATSLVRGPPQTRPSVRSVSLSPRCPGRRRRTLRARTSRLASTRERAATLAAPLSGDSAILIPLVFTHAEMRSVRRRLLRAPPP